MMRALLLLGLATVLLCAAFAATRAWGSGTGTVASEAPIALGSGPLTEDGFWALVDHSAAYESDPDAQLADLRHELDRLTPDQIAALEQHFDALMRQTYLWSLWGAAYVVNGGASDDGFAYFRCWLISKGRRVFEKVIAHPDDLADLLAPGERGGDLEFEEFAYVARDAWAKKTGRDWNAMPHVANMAYDSAPPGTPFQEDPAFLAARYPKLWRRFGH